MARSVRYSEPAAYASRQSVASAQKSPATLTVSYRRLGGVRSGRKHLEHPYLFWGRCEVVAARLGVDLRCVPMLPDHAGGDAGPDASGGLFRVDVPRVEQEHGLDAPWPGNAARCSGQRRRSGEDQVVIQIRESGGIQQPATFHVPLDVDRATFQRTGPEATVEALVGGRFLQRNAEDLGGDPLAEMPCRHRPADNPGNTGVDAVAFMQKSRNVRDGLIHARQYLTWYAPRQHDGGPLASTQLRDAC
jgi:hypothetical protein